MAHKAFELDGIGVVTIYKRRNNRSLRLTVAADGAVRLTMPLWVPYKAGLAFTHNKADWIVRQQANRRTVILADGQHIGKSHRLVLSPSETVTSVTTRIKNTEVRVTYPAQLAADDPVVQQAAERAGLRALRSQADNLLGQRVRYLSERHQRPYRSLTVKRLKSRWGSCDQQRNIVLNTYLIQLPWELIDYVILHELAHTVALNHGPDFWQELERLEPKARERRKAIRRYQPTLLYEQPLGLVA